MSVGAKVAKAAIIIMVAMLLSRILGFFREMLIGAKFGQNPVTDAYIAAFSVPDFLYFLLVGGALSTAFIPVFSEYIAKKKEEEAWEVANTYINIILLLMVTGITLGIIFTPYLIPLVAHGFEGETLERTIYLTRIMFPSVLFTGLSGIAMGILNSHQHFLSPALGSVLYNVSIIIVGLWLSDSIGIAAFSMGVVVGAMANFAVQIPALWKIGMRYRPVLNWRHSGVRRIGTLMVPALIGLSIVQVEDIFNQNMASALEAGSITALRFANRLMQLPLGVFAIAVAIAIFPTLNTQAARGEIKDFKETASLGIRTVIFITLPAAVGLMILRVPIVQLLFEHGVFDHQATLNTAYALFFYAVGLFAHSAIQVQARIFYALQLPSIPVKISAVSLAVLVFCSLLLVGPMAHGGLALAFSLSGIVGMIVYLVVLRLKLGAIGGKKLALSAARTLAASLLMGLAIHFTWWGLEQLLDLSSKLHLGLAVFSAGGVGIGIYGALALALRMEEAHMVADMVKRRLGRKKK